MVYNKYMSFRHEVKNLTSFFAWLFQARWVVDDTGCLGFRIAGMNFWYYKYTSPHCATYPWHTAEKREFGETVKSVLSCQPLDHSWQLYPTQEITPPVGDAPYDATCRVCGTRSVGYPDQHCPHCGCVS